ncbi:MAG TPA: 2,3-bisphosphoglycerate-independent phosphoglycerate mutase [Cryomorphaceae bacterium]|nr:2,3-bisphosphoglycerate-independent phosphoglycerate mutase [Cryomorphaceae bacterium]
MMEKKVVLMILDGWGIGNDEDASAIANAETPYIDSLYKNYPNSRIDASGVAVGLPQGQMGNSEVGHINLGAGRVVYQMLLKINLAIEDHSFHKNKVLIDALKKAQEKGQKVHIMGLVSDGGVHSHTNHLKALTEVAAELELENVFVHAFTDGRDTDPKSGKRFLKELQDHLDETTGKIATVTGRYYAMDRDQRWEQRLKPAYDALVHAKGERTDSLMDTLEKRYQENETDEFIKPIILTENGEPLAFIADGDLVIGFNFRTDRLREMTMVLSQKDMPEEGMETLDIDVVTMTKYDEKFKGIKVLFESDNLDNTLGEVLSKAGKKQFRLAESIKYPHVTYFFNGGREEAFEGEERHMCKTPGVETFDKAPEMAAACIGKKAVEAIEKGTYNFICMNFANTDMVAHTGDMEAAIKACEAVDAEAKKVCKSALDNGYTVLLTADHGNAEKLKNADGSPNTEHTINPVPLILISTDTEKLSLDEGKLADIGPTVLHLLGVKQPETMTGKVLIVEGK